MGVLRLRGIPNTATPTLWATAGVECGISGAEPRGSVEESLLSCNLGLKGSRRMGRMHRIHSGINHSIIGKNTELEIIG